MREPGVDLHVHTSCSDGLDSPATLLAQAARRLGCISFCDHDTIEAYDQLPVVASPAILPGVELSTRWIDGTGVHLLAYFPGGFSPTFVEQVAQCRRQRSARIEIGVQGLRQRGIPLRWQTLAECVGGGVACRSHVARVLVGMGYGRTTQAVFDRFLTPDPFPAPELTTLEAVRMVRDCGGLSVWAHPAPAHVERFGESLVAAGLQGLECYLPRRSQRTTAALLAFAAHHRMLVSGGSDHHGTSRRWPLGRFAVAVGRISRELFGDLLDPVPR